MITTSDSLQFLTTKQEHEFNILYADPPYALGSTVIVRPDGKVDYHKASDFMSKWEMPTGDYWEKWFKEAHRVLKNGGWLIMFGIDRQLLLFKYYALLAGFEEQQSLYWYFISNFPKATDLSKMIDKVGGKSVKWFGEWLKDWRKKNNITQKQVAELFPSATGGLTGCVANWELGLNVPTPEQFTKIVKRFNLPFESLEEAEREVIGELKTNVKLYQDIGNGSESGTVDITAPSTDLAKKYDGYKYSISPLKQTNETIMIFKKPSKTGSVLHDTLAFENGDTTINVSALDIDGNRVGTEKITQFQKNMSAYHGNKLGHSDLDVEMTISTETNGRYPTQTFIDNQVAEILDEQSGVSVSKSFVGKLHDIRGGNFGNNEVSDKMIQDSEYKGGYDDIGGASKILHKCNYEQDDVTLYHYEPKVSGSERNAGLGGFDPKLSAASEFRPNHLEKTLNGENGNPYGRWKPLQNNHPTLKPIDLNYRILKLFKLPTDQKICYPFAGSGSEIIGGIKAGFENWVGCEINAEYVAIANARINYWKETMWEQQSLFDEVI
jgi:DNA modification methylase/transcriptional regulator with XRE-family HTH domain